MQTIRTTVLLPESLYTQAKISAASSHQSLTQLIVRGLESVLYVTPPQKGLTLKDAVRQMQEAHPQTTKIGDYHKAYRKELEKKYG